MKKPIIGITGASQFTPQVRDMVERFFNAIPLDIMQNGKEDLTRIANFCHGFIFAGGVDLFPSTLGREVQVGLAYTKFDKRRDLREKILIDIAAEQGKKIFGICRGHQMLLSHAGLYLIPDISRYSDVCHNPRDIEVQGEPIHYIHGVGNGIEEFAKREMVNSFHHQGILFQGEENAAQKQVEVLGVSTTTYESERNEEQQIIELARGKNFLCCQWHPEADWESVESSEKVLKMAKNLWGLK